MLSYACVPFTLLLSLSPALALSLTNCSRIVIPSSSFASAQQFSDYWTYNYPWGTDHNGGARMSDSQVSLFNNTLILTAVKVKDEHPASSGGKKIPVNYLSGTVTAKQHFTILRGGGFDFNGEFRATITKGTWPAIWLTAVQGWPPELDIAEWKGKGKVHFNTFNSSREVEEKAIQYSSPDEFHTMKAEVRDLNGKDLGVQFYVDGKPVAAQTGRGFVGRAMYLIIDLQMEGSSGSPGPNDDTEFQVRNLEVIAYSSLLPNFTRTRRPEVRKLAKLV